MAWPEPGRGQPETRKEIVMAPDRRAALTAGALFIAATAATLLSTAIEHPVLAGTDYLTRIAGNTNLSWSYASYLSALRAKNAI